MSAFPEPPPPRLSKSNNDANAALYEEKLAFVSQLVKGLAKWIIRAFVLLTPNGRAGLVVIFKQALEDAALAEARGEETV